MEVRDSDNESQNHLREKKKKILAAQKILNVPEIFEVSTSAALLPVESPEIATTLSTLNRAALDMRVVFFLIALAQSLQIISSCLT